jgi:cytolysin (calcineurin-like family phosphatase)
MKNVSIVRSLLGMAATGLVLLAAVCATDADPRDEPIAFFLVGDTHLLANKLQPDQLDERSVSLVKGLVNRLNTLAGTEIPQEAGGGKVLPPRGLIHAGDCIDTGAPDKIKMHQTEWSAFTQAFGLTGKDGRLNMPIYEVHGNHDGNRSTSHAIKNIIVRNKTRPGVTNVSPNGLHYSWDWGQVHFVNLGVIVGKAEEVKRKRRYDPLDSLEFLKSDLKEKIGSSGKPIVITHHIDMLRYSLPLPVEDKKAEAMEWDPADVKAFYDALCGYNVAGILYGHTHKRDIFRWDGSPKAAGEGIPVFNVSKASHFSSKKQAFFYMEIRNKTITAREFQTADGWDTGSWTPQSWTAPIINVQSRKLERTK